MKLPKFSKNFRISPVSIRNKLKFEQEKLDAKIDTLRSKIFSEELGELVKQVTEKKQVLKELKEKPFELFGNLDTELLNNLNKVFSSKNKKLSLSEYFSHQISKKNLYSLVLFQFYPHEGLYKPEIYFGISSETGERFYFHSTGKYLKQINGNIGFLEFNETLRGDVFFQKKIHPADFEKFSGVLFYKFELNGLKGMLGCFCEKKFSSLKEFELFFQEILEPIYPVIGVFFYEQRQNLKNNFDDYWIYNQIVRYAKGILIRGESEKLYIYTLQIQNYFDIKDRWEKKKLLVKILVNALKDKGYIIEKSLQSYYCVSKFPCLELLQESLHKTELNSLQIFITQSEYPEDSPNLFMHF